MFLLPLFLASGDSVWCVVGRGPAGIELSGSFTSGGLERALTAAAALPPSAIGARPHRGWSQQVPPTIHTIAFTLQRPLVTTPALAMD